MRVTDWLVALLAARKRQPWGKALGLMTEDDFKGLKLHRLIRTYACLTRRGPEPAFRGPFQHDGEERFYADINHHVGHHFCGAIEVCC